MAHRHSPYVRGCHGQGVVDELGQTIGLAFSAVYTGIWLVGRIVGSVLPERGHWDSGGGHSSCHGCVHPIYHHYSVACKPPCFWCGCCR